MAQGIMKLTKGFLNLIYPLRCAACGKDLDPMDASGVCERCLEKVRRNPLPHCRACGKSLHNASDLCGDCARKRPEFDKAYSGYMYEGVVKELIHVFKYNGRTALSKILTKFIVDFISENPEISSGADIITYVPLESRRLRERSFNQSKVLAAELSRKLEIPVTDALEKVRITRHQNELSREERLRNLKGAFSVKRNADIANKAVLLIDDVMTTGATFNECAVALKTAGAKQVRCLSLARGA